MYPSAQNPTYGTFVKQIDQLLCEGNFDTKRLVIDQKTVGLQKAFTYLIFYLQLLLEGIKGKYKLIYAHYPTPYALPLLMLALLGKKIVIHVHGTDLTPKNRLHQFGLKLLPHLLKRTQLLIIPSNYFLEKVKKYKHRQLLISPSGGVSNLFFDTPISSGNVTRKVGFISRIDKGKGWKIAIEAVQAFNATAEHIITLEIIGSGNEVSDLEKFIADKPFVTFLGAKEHHLLASYLSTYDAFLFTSELEESLGLVGVEALACGVPVIAADHAGPSTYIQHGTNGWLYADVMTIPSHLKTFYMMDNTARHHLREKCRTSVIQYRSDAVGKQLNDTFIQLVE